MKKYDNVDLFGLCAITLLLSFTIGFVWGILSEKNKWENKIVARKCGNFYIDKNNDRKFKWSDKCVIKDK